MHGKVPTLSPPSYSHACSADADGCLHAGKVQRKFVLLAPPGGSVAAVIVEAQKFAFVYYAVPASSSHGLHQVRVYVMQH